MCFVHVIFLRGSGAFVSLGIGNVGKVSGGLFEIGFWGMVFG